MKKMIFMYTIPLLEVMKQAVELIDGRAQTECSGNITKENIARICEIGVDFVSISISSVKN